MSSVAGFLRHRTAPSATVRNQSDLGPYVRRVAIGLGLVVLLTSSAQLLAALQEMLAGRALIEALVLSLLLGVLVRNAYPRAGWFESGASFAARPILEVAVVLLGASINVAALSAAGFRLGLLIVVGVATVLVLGFLIGRLLGLGWRLALLVATGNAICGNSAIAAVAPIIGADRHEVASSIALTAVLGILLVLALPMLIPLAHLSDYQYGVVAGMGVYAVPQVVAAAFPVGDLSGEVATAVKLARVMLLGPYIVLVGLIVGVGARQSSSRAAPFTIGRFVPWFVVGFVVLALLRASGIVPDIVAQPVRAFGSWLTLLALAGLGLGVRLSVVRVVGPRVALAVVASLATLLLLTLVLLRVLAIDG